MSICCLAVAFLLQGWMADAFGVGPTKVCDRVGILSPQLNVPLHPQSSSLSTRHRHSQQMRRLRMSTTEEDEKLGLKKIQVGDKDFWMRQKELIQEMKDTSDSNLRAEMREKFAQRRLALVGDTAYIGFFIFCALWTFSANPFVAISYVFGSTMGLAYAYGLGRYVENLGGSIDDTGTAQGAGVGEARFAFLILLIIFVGKFRSVGLMEIPSIAGFFTYQLASLRQGLREYND